MRILVVEDDPILADGLKAGLGLTGAAIDAVSTLHDAEIALVGTDFDAMLLDLMLPDGSGLDLLNSLRLKGNLLPVILLTALDETAHRVRGLDSGADDYIGKPFDLDELAARLRAVTRRREGRAAPALSAGGVTLDPATLTATTNHGAVTLSRREFAVLSTLMQHPGVIRSRGELEDRLYGWQEEVESNAVEVHIHNLRNKIGRDVIETVRGLGYRLRTEP